MSFGGNFAYSSGIDTRVLIACDLLEELRVLVDVFLPRHTKGHEPETVKVSQQNGCFHLTRRLMRIPLSLIYSAIAL